jgi:hypothetical protein
LWCPGGIRVGEERGDEDGDWENVEQVDVDSMSL